MPSFPMTPQSMECSWSKLFLAGNILFVPQQRTKLSCWSPFLFYSIWFMYNIVYSVLSLTTFVYSVLSLLTLRCRSPSCCSATDSTFCSHYWHVLTKSMSSAYTISDGKWLSVAGWGGDLSLIKQKAASWYMMKSTSERESPYGVPLADWKDFESSQHTHTLR